MAGERAGGERWGVALDYVSSTSGWLSLHLGHGSAGSKGS